jgi:Domain of unknown function (DUF397)
VDLSRAEWIAFNRDGAIPGGVEIAFLDGKVAVRDGKSREGPVMAFSAKEWRTFLSSVADGVFELPRAPTPVVRAPTPVVRRSKFAIRLVRSAAAPLPAEMRTRWIEEWCAELAVLKSRRAQWRFAWQLFRGIPQLTIALRRSAQKNARA